MSSFASALPVARYVVVAFLGRAVRRLLKGAKVGGAGLAETTTTPTQACRARAVPPTTTHLIVLSYGPIDDDRAELKNEGNFCGLISREFKVEKFSETR